MKRLFLGLTLCMGMLFAGTTSASATVLCHDDPTIGYSVPGVSGSTTITHGALTVYGTTGGGSTSVGFTLATP